MNGLEHGVSFANIGAARRPDAALKFRRFIRQDIAVLIRQDKYLKLISAFFID
jgi:hypothetical protein